VYRGINQFKGSSQSVKRVQGNEEDVRLVLQLASLSNLSTIDSRAKPLVSKSCGYEIKMIIEK
jgi:hypothetical protein